MPKAYSDHLRIHLVKAVESGATCRVAAAGGPTNERLDPGVSHIGMVTAFAPLLRHRAPVLEDTLAFVKANIKTN